MEFGYRSLGMGLLIALVVVFFTFVTAVTAAALQSYNLAVSVAFLMGGLFSTFLSLLFKSECFSGSVVNPDEKEDR